MKKNNAIKKINKLFCSYIGIEQQFTTPYTVIIAEDQLSIQTIESYKRHLHRISFDDFDFHMIREKDKKKLAIASGKAIAKKLIISFDNPTINFIKK